MKKFLIFTLVMALVFGFVSPTLAKGGNGNGGNGGNNGQGNNSNNNGDSNRNQNRNTERHENRVGDGMPDFYVITGEVTASHHKDREIVIEQPVVDRSVGQHEAERVQIG